MKKKSGFWIPWELAEKLLRGLPTFFSFFLSYGMKYLQLRHLILLESNQK